MAKKKRRQDEPRSSEDLIKEARASWGGGESGGAEASEDLMDGARAWLEEGAPAEPIGDIEGFGLPAEIQAEIDAEIEYEIPRVTSPPVVRPSRQRPTATRPRRTRRQPEPTDPFGTGTKRKTGIIAVLVGIAVLGVVASAGVAFIAAETQGPTRIEQESEGSISSAADPCSGAEISGDLIATIVYETEDGSALVEMDIVGPALSGSDGSTYVLDLFGRATGSESQSTFVFESLWMTMTRSDGLVFEDVATITIEIVDGAPDDWSYSTAGSECPG